MSLCAPAAAARRVLLPLLLCCALLSGTTACGGDGADGDRDGGGATPTGTGSAERQKFAKTRFVANAGLAAGATYQWIVKPYREGKFTSGADGRTFALVKAGLAGAFTYNRLKAALRNAQGDPALAKAVAPLTTGVEALKDLPGKLRKGESTESVVSSFDGMINKVKGAGKDAGAEVENRVPSAGELTKG
ncbi:hypothetical protein [Streptomyces sp. NPDC017941]|uniref:hypothetical protein n=1 Tax=unclassified Streptomyces TaxID=2593676 RepID=UPI00378F0B8E